MENKETEPRDVTTDDLRMVECTIDHQKSVVPIKYPITRNGVKDLKPIVILKLGQNQSIDITCLAKKGKGKQHIKWSP